jgi:hypothetical protein
MTVWVPFPKADGTAMLPFLLLIIERYGLSRRRAAVPLIGATAAWIFLCGQPEVILPSFYFALCYGLCRAFQERKTNHISSSLMNLIAGMALSVLLCGAVLLPFLEYLTQSARLQERAAWSGLQGILPWKAAIIYLLPDGFGSHAGSVRFSGPRNYNEIMAYAGTGSVLLAMLGAFTRKKAVRLIMLTGLFVAGAIYGLPGLAFLFRLIPGFSICLVNKFIFLVNFCLAVIAAEGIEVVSSRRRKIIAGLLYAVLFGASLQPVVRSLGGLSEQMMMYVAFQAFLGTCALLLVVTELRIRRLLLTLVLAIDLFHFGYGYLPTIPREQIFPETNEISLLQRSQKDGRIASAHPILLNETNLVYNLRSISGHDSFIPRRINNLLNILRDDPLKMWTSTFRNYDSQLWDIFSVEAFLTDGPMTATKPSNVLGNGEKFSWDLQNLAPCTGLRIANSLLIDTAPAKGEPVADIRVEFDNGTSRSWTMQYGIDTDSCAGGSARLHRVVKAPNGDRYNIYQAILEWDGRLVPVSAELKMRAADCRMVVEFIEPIGAHWDLIEAGPLMIYSNRDALPRAFLTSGWLKCSDQEALEKIKSARVDLRKTACIGTIGAESVSRTSDSVGASNGECRIIRWTSQRIEIETEASEDRILHISQTFYPGWKVFRDGDAIPAFTVNAAFTGAFAPAGRHTFILEYWPVSYLAGLFFSLIAIMIIAAIIADISVDPRSSFLKQLDFSKK